MGPCQAAQPSSPGAPAKTPAGDPLPGHQTPKGRSLLRPTRAIAICGAWTLQAMVGYLISWTASGAPANPGVESVGPWNTARRHTPLRFLAPGQPVISNPEKPMMW